MSDADFQVRIDYTDPDGCPATAVWNNVAGREADRVLRYWRRPARARFGSLMLVDAASGEELAIRWKNVLAVRVQPQREVIR